jgi:IS1 family transposase
VPGGRTAENVAAVVEDVKRRTGGRLLDLITTDGYPAYESAILDAYGATVTPPRTGKRGRPRAPNKVAPPGLTYAVVEKAREKGRVVSIATRVVFGTMAAVIAALGTSRVSRAINTAFVERQHGTDRHRNARKARKTYRFSKDWQFHEAVTYLMLYAYNFCWPVRTLAIEGERGRRRPRSPAMAAGLANHVWTMAEWFSMPAVRRCRPRGALLMVAENRAAPFFARAPQNAPAGAPWGPSPPGVGARRPRRRGGRGRRRCLRTSRGGGRGGRRASS